MFTNPPPLPPLNRSFTDTDLAWLTGDEMFAGLSYAEIIVYGFVQEFGPVHSSDIQIAATVNRRTAREALESLRETGLLASYDDPRGPNKLIYYIPKDVRLDPLRGGEIRHPRGL